MSAIAERLLPQQYDQLDHETRVRTDTTTWLAETLNGNMRTSFEFSFDGEELYGEDGGGLTEVFDDAIRSAQLITQENPGLLFELRRRLIERGELDDIKAMARGELYTDDGEPVNTIVVTSDFPPELMGPGEDVGGYNRSRRQTMERIITLEGDVVRVTTQSWDQSNRQALEAVHGAIGNPAKPGELLSQRTTLNLPPKGQSTLMDNLTAVYDGSMSQQHGGVWYAGRRPADYHNTYDFARSQHDLVDWFTAEKMADPVAAEKLRYGLAATAKARYERYLQQDSTADPTLGSVAPESLISVEAIANGQNLSMELERESRRAARLGEVFSGCGASVSAEQSDELSSEEQYSALGYGNKSGSDRFGSLKFRCQNGHPNERPRNKLIPHCTTCGVSVKC